MKTNSQASFSSKLGEIVRDILQGMAGALSSSPLGSPLGRLPVDLRAGIGLCFVSNAPAPRLVLLSGRTGPSRPGSKAPRSIGNGQGREYRRSA